MNADLVYCFELVYENDFEAFRQNIRCVPKEHLFDINFLGRNICHEIIYERTDDSLKWIEEIFLVAQERHCVFPIDAEIGHNNYGGRTMYLMACAWGCLDVMAFLHQHGADIHHTTRQGETARSIIETYYNPINTDEESTLDLYQQLVALHEKLAIGQVVTSGIEARKKKI